MEALGSWCGKPLGHMRGYNEVQVQASVVWPDLASYAQDCGSVHSNGEVAIKGDDHSLSLFDSTFLRKSLCGHFIEIKNEQVVFKLLFCY